MTLHFFIQYRSVLVNTFVGTNSHFLGIKLKKRNISLRSSFICKHLHNMFRVPFINTKRDVLKQIRSSEKCREPAYQDAQS